MELNEYEVTVELRSCMVHATGIVAVSAISASEAKEIAEDMIRNNLTIIATDVLKTSEDDENE